MQTQNTAATVSAALLCSNNNDFILKSPAINLSAADTESTSARIEVLAQKIGQEVRLVTGEISSKHDKGEPGREHQKGDRGFRPP
jgi:hypothetical protein